MAGSMREALMEAYDAVETAEATGEPVAPRTLEPIVDEPGELGEVSTSGDGGDHADAPLESQSTQTVKPAPKKTVLKDGPGTVKKVSPAAKTTSPGRVAAPASGDGTNSPATPAQKTRAPQSWRPEIRTHWEGLPTEVQAEILKRETEVTRGLTEAANSRRFANDFSQTIRPFEHLLLASGVKNPLVAVRNLMTTAASLQTGTQAQKALTIANIIKAYGVDIATLDQVLSGRQPPKDSPAAIPDEVIGAVRRELAPIREFMGRQQQQTTYQQQQLEQESAQTIEQFAADPENEFYEDLREDMADLLDMAARRGRIMTIQEAYERSAASHPDISKLVAKKKAQAAAVRSRAGIDRARRASSSLAQGTPAAVGGGSARPVGLRGAVSQAFDDLSA
jgi:hypothetical protein